MSWLEKLLELIDRAASGWFAYRAGKFKAKNDSYEVLMDEIKRTNEIRDRIRNDPDYRELVRDHFKRE